MGQLERSTFSVDARDHRRPSRIPPLRDQVAERAPLEVLEDDERLQVSIQASSTPANEGYNVWVAKAGKVLLLDIELSLYLRISLMSVAAHERGEGVGDEDEGRGR